MMVDLQLADNGGDGAGDVSHFSLCLCDDSFFFLALDKLFFVLVIILDWFFFFFLSLLLKSLSRNNCKIVNY
jgi:hypothetical protein